MSSYFKSWELLFWKHVPQTVISTLFVWGLFSPVDQILRSLLLLVGVCRIEENTVSWQHGPLKFVDNNDTYSTEGEGHIYDFSFSLGLFVCSPICFHSKFHLRTQMDVWEMWWLRALTIDASECRTGCCSWGLWCSNQLLVHFPLFHLQPLTWF